MRFSNGETCLAVRRIRQAHRRQVRLLNNRGVIVPTKVERTALQNAASISSLLLTTDAIISEIKEDKLEQAGASAEFGSEGVCER